MEENAKLIEEKKNRKPEPTTILRSKRLIDDEQNKNEVY